MKTLNLYSPESGNVEYVVHKFPDGEIHLELTSSIDYDLEKDIRIIAPIRNASELFLFLQAVDVTRQIANREIVIPYLMSARNDRRMNDRRPLSLKIVIESIMTQTSENDKIRFITPHNEEEISKWISFNAPEHFMRNVSFEYPLLELVHKSDTLVVFPDNGAEKRFGKRVYADSVVAEKERDESGKIVKFTLNLTNIDIFSYKNIVVVDDLIDGGATFRILATSIHDQGITLPLTLITTHFIQDEGLLELTKHYDKIYVMNSFKELPEFRSRGFGVVCQWGYNFKEGTMFD